MENKDFDSEYVEEIASTIINQMGGARKLKSMINARYFMCSTTVYDGYVQPCVYFSFSMNPKIKALKVIYEEGKDTYVMQFLGRTGKLIKEVKDVYCDMLIPVFEQETKLYLRLF